MNACVCICLCFVCVCVLAFNVQSPFKGFPSHVFSKKSLNRRGNSAASLGTEKCTLGLFLSKCVYVCACVCVCLWRVGVGALDFENDVSTLS